MFVAFTHMARNLETYFEPSGAKLVDREGRSLQVTEELKPSQLVVATTEFSAYEVSVSSLQSATALNDDPWAHCPACAVTDRTRLDDGELRMAP